MKYVKKSIAWALLLSLVFCFTGCQQEEVDERKLSVFDLKISDEAKKEVVLAMYVWAKEKEGVDYPMKNWDYYADPPGQYSMHGDRYYGTFDDCIVWCSPSTADSFTDFELAGSRFIHPTLCLFYVCRDGKHFTLQEAYDLGYISAEDVAIVAERHAAYNEAAGYSRPTQDANG